MPHLGSEKGVSIVYLLGYTFTLPNMNSCGSFQQTVVAAPLFEFSQKQLWKALAEMFF